MTKEIKWEDGAVCYAGQEQWFAHDKYLLINKYEVVLTPEDCKYFDDFQLNHIRTQDFIETLGLDTEQKYNDVVEVFGLFGYQDRIGFDGLDHEYCHLAISDERIAVGASKISKSLKRRLTYSQTVAIGKLKRMMLEREKSAPKISPDLTPDLTPDVEPKTATDYLQECMEVQKQRGKQYDSKGTGERSFDAAAKAFNAMTGQSLKGSDVCLILTCVKAVRQYSSPNRLHEDSLLDLVSYASLWAEELNKEIGDI